MLELYIFYIWLALFLMGVIGVLFCSYLLYRNKRVYLWRCDQLSKWWDPNDIDLAIATKDINALNNALGRATARLKRYESLPDYDTMLWKFWVWPLDRFLPKEHK